MINNQLDKLLNSQDSKDLINLMKHFMLKEITFFKNNFSFDESKLASFDMIDSSMDDYYNRQIFLKICAEFSSLLSPEDNVRLILSNNNLEFSIK